MNQYSFAATDVGTGGSGSAAAASNFWGAGAVPPPPVSLSDGDRPTVMTRPI